MVSHQRTLKKALVEESQNREERYDEISQREKQWSSPGRTLPPEERETSQQDYSRQIANPQRSIDVPLWINRTQVGGPEGLVQIKPGYPPRGGQAGKKTGCSDRISPHRPVMLEPHGRQSQRQRQAEERQAAQPIFPPNLAMQPPQAAQQHHGQQIGRAARRE